MTTSQNGLNLIKEFEGCKLSAYALGDGKWTVGYGNTFYEDGTPVKEGDTITQERADSLLLLIVPKFEQQLESALKVTVNQNQWDALLDFVYNVGIGNFEQSTLLRVLNANPNDPTIRNDFMMWVDPGTKFEAGATRRRTAEADLYFTPIQSA